MPKVLPFEIENLTFEDVEGNASLSLEAHEIHRRLSREATRKWRSAAYVPCGHAGRDLTFAVTDTEAGPPGRPLDGAWFLYKMLPIGADPNVVGCKVGPMFPEIGSIRLPGQTADAAREAQTSDFFRKTLRIMGSMLDNPMLQDDGTDLVIDHFLGARREDNDPIQHEWVDVEEFFNSHSLKPIQFDIVTGGGLGLSPDNDTKEHVRFVRMDK